MTRQGDSARWDRIYDKLQEVQDKVHETNVEMARVTQQMADHVESDTDWFAKMDNNFTDLRDQLNTLCLSKAEARKESSKISAVISAIGLIGAALITACGAM